MNRTLQTKKIDHHLARATMLPASDRLVADHRCPVGHIITAVGLFAGAAPYWRNDNNNSHNISSDNELPHLLEHRNIRTN